MNVPPRLVRAADWILNHPKLSVTVAGAMAAYAMAPFYIWPLMMLALCVYVLAMARITSPWRGAWTTFFFGMGFFTFGLWWIVNALMMDIRQYWWALGFSILGLPVLLSLLWFVAGWLAVRLTPPGGLARAVATLTLLMAAEYGRAFNLSGFPWNLFGYMWADVPALMQSAAIGGAYYVTFMTSLWMALPALLWLARPSRRRQVVIAVIGIGSFAASFAWGAWRLAEHPATPREDTAVVIVQPNITPDEKWRPEDAVEHFKTHIDLTRDGLSELDQHQPPFMDVAVVWPETALDEQMVMGVPEVPKLLVETLRGHPYRAAMVTGLWREDGTDSLNQPNYYNSVGDISLVGGKLNLDDVYNKHHLVPFGEYIPLEQTLHMKPIVGFAGFKWGTGPKVLQSPVVPPVAPMICFEAIFPWYGKSEGAQWLVNTSNDGWYGDTAGPYQHLAMTRFRAVEQGKPVIRSATTGISAVIGPYGRVLRSVAFNHAGYIALALPDYIKGGTLYTYWGETPFFALLAAGLIVAAFLRLRNDSTNS
ncbi:MAG: apolipoprotein N-acyltransferase [Rhodospirillales bacterium]|nr:apolipoprotein N-acyltransferase [Alphaproteobacteria bacterium]MCB9987443.1 apolipoprotein N-acyltransferase [Rhodospirillales bacterium]USO07577.1 MAG: apolipoprotein N-acyltransferase [Rhodospirillales bacterium]